MKLAVCLSLFCLCISINAYPVNEEHVFGDVLHGEIMGTEHIKALVPIDNRLEYTVYQFTYPKVREIVIDVEIFNKI